MPSRTMAARGLSFRAGESVWAPTILKPARSVHRSGRIQAMIAPSRTAYPHRCSPGPHGCVSSALEKPTAFRRAAVSAAAW